jgi:pimeloyl-ACP methyl ester carboxylesterase
VHGGDLGVWTSLTLAAMRPQEVAGAHVTFLLTPPSGDPAELAALDQQDLGRLQQMVEFMQTKGAYMHVQGTRPQTLAYGLTDSPVGQLAWITEKFFEWSDSEKSPEDAITRDQLLTNVSLYWLTATAGSSANLYYEMADLLPIAPTPPPAAPPHPVPLAVAVYAHDASLAIRKLAEPNFPNLVQWSEFDRGGHFSALEQPELFVDDLRAFSAKLAG